MKRFFCSSFGKSGSSKNTGANVQMIRSQITQNPVVIYTKTPCPFCKGAKELLNSGQVEFKEFDLLTVQGGSSMHSALIELSGQKSVPNIFIAQNHIGGFDKLKEKHSSGDLKKMLDNAGVKNIL